jgi:hypothetical protein
VIFLLCGRLLLLLLLLWGWCLLLLLAWRLLLLLLLLLLCGTAVACEVKACQICVPCIMPLDILGCNSRQHNLCFKLNSAETMDVSYMQHSGDTAEGATAFRGLHNPVNK